ncbi:MAG: endonuclease/exonuclease/phosphatase family protein [Limnochordia bacterium]|jgi:endonuclease/exonuclease/phosphatase (EEP) superfamily protein YafD
MGNMLPLRFVATSYNIWETARWPERENALRAFLQITQPDILCIQEIRPVTREVLDAELPQHERIDDPFEGWLREGNIYWSKAIFEKVTYGAEDIGMLEPLRRLFWVRLQFKGRPQTLLVTTAHYTYQGNKREVEEGFNPRLAQADKTMAALDKLAEKNEPVLFMGDLNDSVNAIRRLRAAGLQDSFLAMGMAPKATHPALPTARGTTPRVLDWQFHRGPLRVMNTNVMDFYVGDFAPSDHKPVVTTYALIE